MTVRAAGGIVLRDGGSGPEVLLVHRPRYDDWSIPKGKAEPGETDEQCAVREVTEETGFAVELGARVGQTSYVDQRGRPKTVVFFLMNIRGGSFAPNDEVDVIRWCPVTDLATVMAHPGERDMIEQALRAGSR
jgi:8-oxo-dGTP pyrophosphatase MutT (NUDIX family)